MAHNKLRGLLMNSIYRLTRSLAITIFCLAILFPTLSLPFEKNYDIHHIKLNLNFDLKEKAVIGKETITLIPLQDNFSTFKLHAGNLTISAVKLFNQKHAEFKTDSSYLSITLPQLFNSYDTININIDYQTNPNRGIYFKTFARKDKHKTVQIYSHSEPNDAHYWFPCYDSPDEKSTSEIIATVPENFYLLSNGRLLSNRLDKSNHTRTFHWYQGKPHSPYLISIAAGEYVELRDKAGKTPLFYYVYPDQKDKAPYSFSKTPDMVLFF